MFKHLPNRVSFKCCFSNVQSCSFAQLIGTFGSTIFLNIWDAILEFNIQISIDKGSNVQDYMFGQLEKVFECSKYDIQIEP